MKNPSFLRIAIVIFLVCLIPSSILHSQSSMNFGARYAVIIGGIGGQKEFTEEYFDQTNRMYDLLVNKLDYKSENVSYLFEDLAYDSLKIKAKSTAENVRGVMKGLADKMKPDDQLFIFMVGHGTFDGSWSKFNLVGPDLKDIDYAQLLAKLPTNKIILVNTSSASGPFIKKIEWQGKGDHNSDQKRQGIFRD